MKFVVIGAGMMGRAIAFDLARSKGVERVTLADIDADVLRRVQHWIQSPKVEIVELHADDFTRVVETMSAHECAIGAVSYQNNVQLTKAAIAARVHFCDLGGNDDVIRRQRSMNDEAAALNLSIVPNCGLAPGLANVVAAREAEEFEQLDSIRIRVGGLPQHPKEPFNYQLVFSVEGLVNEYSGKARVLRDFAVDEVDALSGIEEIEFPPPLGMLEAFHTSGGASYLPEMFAGKARSLDYKTIRYAGHCERFRTLLEVGFASDEPYRFGSGVATAREIFHELLKKRLSGNDFDLVVARIEVAGVRRGVAGILRNDIVDYFDANHNISAMMRTTAFPTSLIAQYIVGGRCREVGVKTPEQFVPLEPLTSDLAERGINVRNQWLQRVSQIQDRLPRG
ncbi:MAG: hypothetical protein FJ215_06180 [Ignavibacteria bacterium]|nr:hypothetical protein [Ignavibacteria bacterium]